MTQPWMPLPPDSPFGVEALPFGVFSPVDESEAPRVGVRIGDQVLDIAPVAAIENLDGAQVFEADTLNPFLALGRPAWQAVRSWLIELLTHPAQEELVSPHLLPLAEVHLHLPFEVADYVDFYASEQHATNLGTLFRPSGDPLLPNWKHLPVGYHGRAGTVVVSGTDVVRPSGQRKSPADPSPSFGPSQRLDIEAEVGFVVGTPSVQGEPVAGSSLAEHVFGVCLVNDWSARDIQSWEYAPLGPFLGKSFATSISAWVLPLEALEPARITPPPRSHPLLDYLAEADSAPWGLDLQLEVSCNGTVLSRPPYGSMYWTPAQMLAHLTVNGASLRTGDLLASGTVSGPEPDQRGSFIELSWNGERPVRLDDGSTRTFLQDGDSVTITATAPGANGTRVGLGEVTGRILPAHK